jgi:filamentous hemagglutinin family protein
MKNSSQKSGASLLAFAAFFAGVGAANAGALPGHGRFATGHGAISKSGGILTIDQNSRTGIVDWKSFSVGKHNVVDFNNANGATLNRVTGGNLSRIAGQLHGTGSVYLINNQGVAILPTGRIVTQGSFAASGGNADGGSFGVHKRLLFTGGVNGNVVNRGRIVSETGRADLNGRNVSDSGNISARDVSVIAEGAMRVSGRITARVNKGSGGSVETSGGRVRLSGAAINAKNWLVDPENLTVTKSAASRISAALNNGTNITLKTTATNASGRGVKTSGAGDITILAPLNWSSSATLTLDARHSIFVHSAISLHGAGGLALFTNDEGKNGVLSFAGGHATFTSAAGKLTIDGVIYTLVHTLDKLASDIAVDPSGNFAFAKKYNALQDGVYSTAPISTAFDGNFEGLGNVISHLSIADNTIDAFVGLFSLIGDGANLSNINLVDESVSGKNATYVGGLVGDNRGGKIYGVKVTGFVEGGHIWTGGLVGFNEKYSRVGEITNSSCACNVTGKDAEFIGGLTGETDGNIQGSYSSGTVTGGSSADAGGLAGKNSGSIRESYSTSATKVGTSKSRNSVGGLVGYNTGIIANSYSSGAVTGLAGTVAGGLVGINDDPSEQIPPTAVIEESYATGAVKLGEDGIAGGLVGQNTGAIRATYATGSVTTGAGDEGGFAGGLVGSNYTSINDSYETGAVTGGAGDFTAVGGIAGQNFGAITNTYVTGKLTGGGGAPVGGVVGEADTAWGQVTKSYWDTTTTGITDPLGGSGTSQDPGTIAITTANLKKKLPAGFSSAVWGISPHINGGIPYLKSLNASY